MATAYGVADARLAVDVVTLQDTPRGAMVNWLYNRKGYNINGGWTNGQIRRVWDQHSEGHSVVAVHLTVGEVFDTDFPINVTYEGEIKP